MSKKRIISFFLLLCTVFSLLPVSTISAWAEEGTVEEPKTDAMEEIEATFTDMKIGNTQTIADDGYIGIPVELTIYFDKNNHTITSGHGGTPIIIYVINTYAERVGTDTDAEIIQSMLDRGYVVTVLDYKNDKRAVSPALDWSVQGIRNDIKEKKYFPDPIFPSGTYHDNYVVPAGCDVSLYNVFWEADKHGVDGTLDKIVEIWNADFRSVKGEKLVKWVYSDGTRKKTLDKAKDGTAPVWYAENGAVDANGEYTKVKYTVAETITDCVNPDGSFIDLDLYIHIVYPTNPEKPVPVMSLANSSGYMANSVQTADRPHMNGFLFNGYAGVMFDYFYVPMANDNSFGYYDGANSNGSITGDSLTYSVHVYNDKLVNTAAMRYLRYLALSDPKTYNFDVSAFGVYGNSKGGYMSFLGEKAVQSPLANGSYATLGDKETAIDAAISAFTPFRYLDNHHGETRYQIGETADYTDPASGFTVKGGEKQPWITYGGEEIISGAQLTYVGNGADSESVTEGRMPMIVSVHLNDSYNAAYGESNRFANMCRTMNIPSVIFEVPLGHTLSYGEDLDYGIDAYDTIFSFVGYYLKNDPVSVLYTTPLDRAAGVNVTDKITVKFAGEVSAEEIEKITVTGGSETLSGTWSSSFGDTEWTFTPYAMKGGVTYSVNVPADLKGKNGIEMGTGYTSTFITEYDNASADVSTVTAEDGTYFSFTAPSAMSMGANGYAIRFYVVNNAANVAELYAVDAASYDPNSPDAATVGEFIGKINLKGSGSYEIDVTDHVAERAGEKIVLLLKSQKTAGTSEILYIDYENGTGTVSKDSYVTATVDTATFDGNAVYKITVGNTKNKYDEGHRFYSGVNTAFTQKNILGEAMTEDDYGRRFTLSLRIYDTLSRTVQLRYDTCTDRTTYATRDYDFSIINVRTKANQWVTVELPYTVYDTDYGKVGENNLKDVTVRVGSTGDTKTPIYIDDIKVTETVTDVHFGGIVLAEKNDGGIPYKSPEGDRPIALYNGSTLVGEYDSWNKALSAYKSGYTLKLQSDYTLTDADLYSDFGTNGGAKVSGTLNVFNIDLNGYTLVSGNTVGSLLWLKTDSADISRTEINICGGAILLDRTSLISYEDSSVTDASKIYDVKLTNVYISTVKGAVLTQAISADTVTVGSAVEARISLTGCTIDLPDDKHAKDGIEIFPAGTGSLELSYVLKGGSIRLSAQKFVTVQNNANVTEFLKDASGEYTALILPASKKADSSSYLRDDGYAVYAASGETDENGFAVFRLSKSENSTKYGVIDEAYTDAEKYPWLVFSGGIFRGAYETVIKASDAVTTLVEGTANAKAEAQILLRRDYVNAESGDGFTGLNVIGGTVIIDLGGFTFTRNGSFLDFKSNTVAAPYDNTVIIRNGAIRTMKAAPCDFQYTADQVVDKTFNITIENVTFGLADECKEGTSMELIWVVWDNKRDNVACNANITMNDCVIDLDTNAEVFEDYTAITLFKFYDAYDRVNVDLTVNGGRIIAPDMSHVTFMKGNADSDTVTMGRGSDGRFMTATLTGDGKVIGDNFVTVDGENRSFTKVSGSEGEYELGVNELVTKYGVIPTAYGDAEAYPFVLFFDGKFVGAYSIWGNSSTTDSVDVLDAAKNLISGTAGAGKTAYILMRRDYQMTDDVYYNLSQVGGTVYLDLGGNTFYVGKNDMLYAEGKTKYDTTVTVVNGSIRTTGAGSTVEMRHSTALTSSTKKTFHITFENVTFGIAAGSTAAQPLLYSVNGKGAQCYFDIAMNGCTFDYSTVKPSSAITLFHLASSTDTNYVDLTVNGGTFKLEELKNITLQKTTSNDKVTFKRGSDGEYPVIRTLSTASPIKTVFNTSEGNAVFIEEADDGTKSVYRLTPVPYTTETMSSYSGSFFSGVDYPFAVFIDGKLAENGLKAYLGQAVQRARELTANGSATVQIMLRADHVTDNDNDKTDTPLKYVNGTLILDLNGHALTRGAQYILNLGLGDSCLYKTTVIVKNGTIHNSRYVVGISNNGSTAGAKEYDIIFDNVTIDYKKMEGRELGSIFMAWTKKPGAGADIKLTFNDCTLDLRGAPADTPVFACKDLSTKALVNVDTVISGGNILAIELSQITLLEGDSAGGDTIRFAPDGNGAYTVLTQSTSSPYPDMSFETVSGDTVSFRQVKTVGVNTVYALDSDVKTEYGYIPNIYANAELYPFAVFADGKFVGAYSVWGESSDKEGSALGAAKNAVLGASNAGKTVYILMRRNYTVTSDDLYYNLSQVGGTLVFDMSGYTMTTEHEVFIATAKATSNIVHPSEYVIKNGKFIVNTTSIIKFNDVNNEKYDIAKAMKFRFEDVTFQLAKGYTVSNMICYTANVGYVGSLPQLIFTDCTFDLSNLGSKTVTLINLKDNRNIITGNVTFEGGKIIANTEKGWSISSVNSGKDAVSFEPNENGKYTEFTVSVGYDFRNSAGEKLDQIGANGAYTLAPHNHSYSMNIVAPTCTDGGYTTYTCSCGDSYVSDYTEALGHAYDDKYDADCNNCGEIREVETPVTEVANGKCGVNTTWVLTSDGVLTISGNGDTEDYLVSITTEQPYRAYQDQITKVVIEEGVTSIGRGAFYGFTAITEVVFPESLIAIHEYAFFGCTGIKSVTIHANTFYIGMYAFRKSGLTEMTFANAEGWTFADGTALDVTNVKAFTTEFTYKQTCMRPVTENGTEIANGVFGNNDEFSWTLSSTGVLTVSGIGDMPKFNVNTTPWYGYRGAICSVVIEEGITSVGRCSFHTCRAITNITLPESLETIAEYAFYNCQFLTEAAILANVTRIEIYAFRKCFALKNVEFAINYGWSANGEKISATELNSNAADMLTLVNYTKIWTRDVNAEEEILDPNYVTGGACNTTVKWALTYIDDTKTKMKLTISGTGAMPKFETAGTPWYGYLNDIVEVEVCEGITEIGRCSFYGLKFVKEVTISNTVIAINDYAFNGCFSLKTIEIPESVTYIADTAFTKTGLSEIPTV